MTINGAMQFILYLLVLLICVKPLGGYMAQVYQGRPLIIDFIFQPIERFIYYCCGIQTQQEMDWKKYLVSFLIVNLIGIFILYALQRLQYYFPFNPEQLTAVSPDLAFNTAISFTTNTDWQAYAGESTLSYFTQMIGLTVQNFVSAASGMAILIALIRGLSRKETTGLGNFWVDMVRSLVYILLPLACLLAIALASQGVIQNFKPYQRINLIQPEMQQSSIIQHQIIPMGPVASQISIKQLGTNGGGFFNVNASHPFENPTPCSNFLEMIAILLIPAALCYTFGVMVNDKRQGWAILIAMFILFIPLTLFTIYFEQQGNPTLLNLGIDQTIHHNLSPGGNMEGKETRFGIVNSAIWGAATTASANGSVNSMHDSYTPLGGFILMLYMHFGEVIFGGIGTGLSTMLVLILITVFIAGLMVGRTPEYLGKKIDPFEIKMASLVVLIIPLIVLIFSAIAISTQVGQTAILNPGSHGLTEILYAFTSMTNNNGSAFAGLNTNHPFFNTLGGIALLIGRYWTAITTLAIAGSLVQKKVLPLTSGTLETHSPIFIGLLIGVTIVLGALSFFPVLALGPIVEHLMLWGNYGH